MRFVVLHHTGWPGHPDHYDLMLQMESGHDDDDRVLKTFATLTDAFPDPSAGAVRLALLAPHRRAYLRYQGAVPGQRGQVERVDEGELGFLPELQIELQGQRLRGKYLLRRTEGEQDYLIEKTP